MCVCFFVYDACMVPASPLQLVAYAAIICQLICAGIVMREGIKYKKSRKKDDEETKKW